MPAMAFPIFWFLERRAVVPRPQTVGKTKDILLRRKNRTLFGM
jgi:hypothetical protein